MNTFILSIMMALSNPQLTDYEVGLISMRSVIDWKPLAGDVSTLKHLGLLKPEQQTIATK